MLTLGMEMETEVEGLTTEVDEDEEVQVLDQGMMRQGTLLRLQSLGMLVDLRPLVVSMGSESVSSFSGVGGWSDVLM
jgi:hypothetical protein